MGRRVVAPEREPHSEKADVQPQEVLRKYYSDQEQNKQHHFDDEHRLRPNRSARPPNALAPIRMPNRLAALTSPCCTEVRLNSLPIRGRATPVINTTNPRRTCLQQLATKFAFACRSSGMPAQPFHPTITVFRRCSLERYSRVAATRLVAYGVLPSLQGWVEN